MPHTSDLEHDGIDEGEREMVRREIAAEIEEGWYEDVVTDLSDRIETKV